jgi:Caspase domain
MNNPTQPAARFENGYALLIGAGNYTGVNPLPVTANDAAVLYKLLTHPQRAGYPVPQVKLLTNEQADREGIINGFNWLIEATANNPKATVMVYFSGHGGKRNDEYFLMPNDFTWDRYKSSSISKELFGEKIDKISSRKMMIFLDCCHAAGITTKSGQDADFILSNEALYQHLQEGIGRVVVASSKAAQLSYILRNARYSVFTDTLVDALDGAADDGSGHATVMRTLTYLGEQVKQKMNGTQVPVFEMVGVEDFSICRVNRPDTVQQPFKKTADYLAGYPPVDTEPGTNDDDLYRFKLELNLLLEDNGFSAVPIILERIRNAPYQYNKIVFANLETDGMSPLAAFSPNDYITRLRIFIGSLRKNK